MNTDFEGSWTQLTQSFKVIRISLQFYFPLWRCDLGVILTSTDLSSSAFEFLAQRWSVWQLPCFSSSGYQKKHSWNHSDSSAITRETRQHSTQSVGNMPPPSPRHLLPQVLQIMPRNPKYDQFQPKGHHNEENPQSMTKMPENPKFYPFH